MSISASELKEHIHQKKDATIKLHQAAEEAGFVPMPYEPSEIDTAVCILDAAKIKDLSEIDEFINQNIVPIQTFFTKIVEFNAGYSIWQTPLPYLYQLVCILKDPSFFNKYMKLTNPNERIAKIIELAIDDYQSNH